MQTNSTRLREWKKLKKTKKIGGASLFKEYISPRIPSFLHPLTFRPRKCYFVYFVLPFSNST